MQLKVTKTDGSIEDYLHTKVLGTLNNALAQTDQPDISIAEQLAEAVTWYLYKKQQRQQVTSSEILSMIKAVLTETGYTAAAVALTEHHFERKRRRCRTEVVFIDISSLEDVRFMRDSAEKAGRSRWDKSRIVEKLLQDYEVERQTARTIASLVEEKIFSMNITSVPAGLLKQLMLSQAATVLHAHQQLLTV
jgi:transcriptional regulator NrdR family protein